MSQKDGESSIGDQPRPGFISAMFDN